MSSKPIFNAYGDFVCFVDGREVVNDAARMDAAKIVGRIADREFAQACYDAGIENPESVEAPMETLANIPVPAGAEGARTLLATLIEVHGRKKTRDAA